MRIVQDGCVFSDLGGRGELIVQDGCLFMALIYGYLCALLAQSV